MSASTQLFLLSLAALAGGVVLVLYDKTEAGMVLLGAGVAVLTGAGFKKRKETQS